MLGVIRLLNGATAQRLSNGPLHGGGHAVRIHNHLTVGVAGGAADGLHQAGLGPKEALFVRIQDRHQAHLRNIQSLTQQVNSHQHIEFAQAQIANDLHTLHGIHIMVHIPHLDGESLQILGKVLGHGLGEGSHQHPLTPLGAQVDLGHQVVHLVLGRLDGNIRIQHPGRTDHLFHDLGAAFPLKVAGGGGSKDHLIDLAIEFVKL